MRKFLPLFAAAILVLLPVSAWSQQSDATQAQHPSETVPNRSGQVNKQNAKKPNAEAQSAATTEAPQDALAAAARRAKEQKKAGPKPAKVFTNDDIPSSGGISTVGEKPGASDTAAATAAPEKAGANDEKTWRNRFAMLRHKLDQDQEALAVMQRELGELNIQYYSDPVKAMQQQYTRSDINDKSAQIDAKKKEIDADNQAISDAEDDLRKAGGEPGWAR
jgi:hypothetical protein